MRSAVLLLFLALAGVCSAQPANDDCVDAAILCAGQPLTGDNTGAVGWPGFCAGTAGVLWYTFTTNSVGGPVNVGLSGIDCPDVPGMDNELSLVVLSGDGSCLPASFASVSLCDQDSLAFTVSTDPLLPNTQYWVIVAGALDGASTLAAQCGFALSVDGPGADVVGVDMSAGDDVTIGEGESTQLAAFGGPPYSWSPTSGLTAGDVADPIAAPVSTTIYTLTTQINGCTVTDDVIVEVIRRVVPPNTFTPNGDGINDFWEIPGMTEYPDAAVYIYDRWGQRVFYSTGYREPWDGTNNGKKLSDATYYYHIELNQIEGRSPPYKGFISIVR